MGMLETGFTWKFRTFLRLRNVTMTELAKGIGMSRGGLRLAIDRKTLSIDTFIKIADFFKMEPPALFAAIDSVSNEEYKVILAREKPQEYIALLKKERDEAEDRAKDLEQKLSNGKK